MSLRRRMENDLDRDIREHIEIETRDNIERGMSPDEARSAALRKFGNTLRIMEDTRAVWRWVWADRLLQDVRHGLRGLRRKPVFAAVLILTLALGIGMNTAIFSVVNAVLIKPLPYPDPQRLVWLSTYITAVKTEIVSAPDYLDWRAQSQAFDKMVCYGYSGETIAYGNDAGQATVADVNSDFWPVTGVRPSYGRLFADGDDNVVVLSYPFFKRRFGADSRIVGKTVLLGGQPVTVVGVLPESFRFLLPTPEGQYISPKIVDAYIPTDITPQTQVRGRGRAIVNVVARLKPGVPLGQARSELEAIQARIVRQNAGIINYTGVTLKVVPLREKLVGNARPALLILFGAVAFVLLIACANVAGLLLASAAVRRREVAIRAAVGAGQLRMIAQFLTEAMVLALAGGAAGLLLARGAIAMLLNFAPRAIPRLEGTVIDGRVLASTLLLTLASALLFGLGPALSLARANLQDELNEGRKVPSGLRRLRPRNLLVAAEMAIAVVLTTGAGLMLKSLWRMNARPPGFNPERILTMKVSLTGPAYRARQQQIAYFEELINRLGRAPGAVAAGTIFSPVRGVIQYEGAPPASRDRVPRGIFYSTSPGYFRAMGIRLLEGRWMSVNEPSEVVLVNDSFKRQLFGGANPLGKHVRMPSTQQPPPQAEIVGVVSDVKYSKLDAEPGPEVYFPYRHSFFNGAADVVVLASGDPLALASSARKLISGIDPSQAVFDVQTLDAALAGSIAPRRFNLILLGTFAATALLLAVIGIYGAMSYAVTQRTHEIGVRMALGARQSEVMRMVVRQAMAMALAGIAAGVVAALGLTRLMATLLYDVKPDDPTAFAAVAVTLAATSLLASCAPALKAARVDPLVALRYE